MLTFNRVDFPLQCFFSPPANLSDFRGKCVAFWFRIRMSENGELKNRHGVHTVVWILRNGTKCLVCSD